MTLKQVAADGGKLEAAIDLGIPYLAFYGDWTKAPIIDSTDYGRRWTAPRARRRPT